MKVARSTQFSVSPSMTTWSLGTAGGGGVSDISSSVKSVTSSKFKIITSCHVSGVGRARAATGFWAAMAIKEVDLLAVVLDGEAALNILFSSILLSFLFGRVGRVALMRLLVFPTTGVVTGTGASRSLTRSSAANLLREPSEPGSGALDERVLYGRGAGEGAGGGGVGGRVTGVVGVVGGDTGSVAVEVVVELDAAMAVGIVVVDRSSSTMPSSLIIESLRCRGVLPASPGFLR